MHSSEQASISSHLNLPLHLQSSNMTPYLEPPRLVPKQAVAPRAPPWYPQPRCHLQPTKTAATLTAFCEVSMEGLFQINSPDPFYSSCTHTYKCYVWCLIPKQILPSEITTQKTHITRRWGIGLESTYGLMALQVEQASWALPWGWLEVYVIVSTVLGLVKRRREWSITKFLIATVEYKHQGELSGTKGNKESKEKTRYRIQEDIDGEIHSSPL